MRGTRWATAVGLLLLCSLVSQGFLDGYEAPEWSVGGMALGALCQEPGMRHCSTRTQRWFSVYSYALLDAEERVRFVRGTELCYGRRSICRRDAPMPSPEGLLKDFRFDDEGRLVSEKDQIVITPRFGRVLDITLGPTPLPDK